MSKRTHRPLLAPERELLVAVGEGITRYKDEFIAEFVQDRSVRVGGAHLVDNWVSLFHSEADQGGDNVRSAVLAWMFKNQPEGAETLRVDDLCQMVRKRIGNLRLIPEKTSVAKRAKGLDVCGSAMLKPWTHSSTLRNELRPSLDEITVRINNARIETFKIPSEFKEKIIFRLGAVFSIGIFDLTAHEDADSAFDFTSRLLEKVEEITEENKTKKTSLKALFDKLALWCSRGEGRALLEALAYSFNDVADAVRNSSDPDFVSREDLYEVKKFIADVLIAADCEPEISETVVEDVDDLSEAEEMPTESVDPENLSLEDACPALEDTDVEPDNDSEIFPSLDSNVDSSSDAALEDTCVENISEPKHIAELRAVRFPTDKLKRDVLENIFSNPKRNISFTKGFYRAALAQIDLVLAHPENYTVVQVRVLSEMITRLYSNYEVTSTEKLHPKSNSSSFTQGVILGILSKVRESGPQHSGMKKAQIQIDLFKEELTKIQLLKDLITAAEADPKSQASISRRVLEALRTEREQLPDTTHLKASILEQEPELELCEREMKEMRKNLEEMEVSLKDVSTQLLNLVQEGAFDSIGEVNRKAKEINENIIKLRPELELIEARFERMSEELEALKEEFSGSGERVTTLNEQIDSAELQILRSDETVESLLTLHLELVRREEVLNEALAQVDFQMSAINQLLLAALEGTIDFDDLEQKITQA